jgi:hypothetical protein
MDDDEYGALVDTLRRQPSSLDPVAEGLVRLFPVTGAAVSTLGELLGNETLSASDDLAARVDELQFDLGEGPCWDALTTTRPVLEPDLRNRGGAAWPAFARAVHDDVGAIFAFPMIIGQVKLGAVDMFSTEPARLDRRDTRRAVELATLVGHNVLRLALDQTGEFDGRERPFTRRAVHQATGMVLAQLDVTPDEAGLIIKGHAFASGRSMMEVADDILEGRLSFTRGADGFEETR